MSVVSRKVNPSGSAPREEKRQLGAGEDNRCDAGFSSQSFDDVNNRSATLRLKDILGNSWMYI